VSDKGVYALVALLLTILNLIKIYLYMIHDGLWFLIIGVYAGVKQGR
jgi:hypothetical protein